MLQSAVLDVAIGLTFIFLMVSLLVSTAAEALSGWFKWRSTHLWQGLEQLLQSADARNEIYSHPLIKGLARVNVAAPAWHNGRSGPSYIPSRTFALAVIDTLRRPQTALHDLERRVERVIQDAAGDPAGALASIAAIEQDFASQVPSEVIEELHAVRASTETPADAIKQLETLVRNAPQRWLRMVPSSFSSTAAALSPLMHDAAGDLDRFRENIEIWFNDGMDRVSGWYKRHIGYVQAVIGMVLAVAMNIDALQITRTLWREPTVRETIVSRAGAFERTQGPLREPAPPTEQAADDKSLRAQLRSSRLLTSGVTPVTVSLPAPAPEKAVLRVARQSSNITLGTSGGDVTAENLEIAPAAEATTVEFYAKAGAVSAVTREAIDVNYFTSPPAADTTPHARMSITVLVAPTSEDTFAALQQQIATLGLPIGWSCPPETAVNRAPDPGTVVGGPFWCSLPAGDSGGRWTSASWLRTNRREIAGMLLTMVLGWLITAAAASLGAPFWFDTLKRVISVRSSGKAPEERPLSPKEVPQPREPGQRPKEADLVNALKR
jgi:hypothetical protein